MKITVKFSFLAVLGFILCTDSEGTAVLCLAACALHEIGHFLVMLIEKRLPKEIAFYGGGIHIKGGSHSFLSVSGGCVMNILLFFLFYFMPFSDYKSKLFAVINLLIAAINLLPLSELDGRAIFEKLTIRLMPPEKAVRISDTVERVTGFLAFPIVIFLSFSGIIGFSSLVFLFYLIAVDVFDKM